MTARQGGEVLVEQLKELVGGLVRKGRVHLLALGVVGEVVGRAVVGKGGFWRP